MHHGDLALIYRERNDAWRRDRHLTLVRNQLDAAPRYLRPVAAAEGKQRVVGRPSMKLLERPQRKVEPCRGVRNLSELRVVGGEFAIVLHQLPVNPYVGQVGEV